MSDFYVTTAKRLDYDSLKVQMMVSIFWLKKKYFFN